MDAPALAGWLNVLKPPGMSSHDVVAWVRRATREARPRVGHLGTLDPPATGVLPLCLGSATRLSRFVASHTKRYVFEIVFGTETDTLDYTGAVTRCAPAEFSGDDLVSVLRRFGGEIEQVPPQYSAVHVNGRRAYDLARRGQRVELPVRLVTIHQLTLLRLLRDRPPRALLEVTCSQGTYVRSLCADICAALATVGHVGFLARTMSGVFRQERSHTLDELGAAGIAAALLPLDMPLAHLPAAELSEEAARAFSVGTSVAPPPGLREGGSADVHEYSVEQGKHVRIYSPHDGFLGIAEVRDGLLKPAVVLPMSAHVRASDATNRGGGEVDSE